MIYLSVGLIEWTDTLNPPLFNLYKAFGQATVRQPLPFTYNLLCQYFLLPTAEKSSSSLVFYMADKYKKSLVFYMADILFHQSFLAK